MSTSLPGEGPASDTAIPAQLPRLLRFSALRRLLIALLAAFLVCVGVEDRVSPSVQVLLTWNTGAWIYVSWSLALALHADEAMTREHARSQTQSGRAMLCLVICASLVSMVALGFLIQAAGNLSPAEKLWHVTLSVTALLAAWSLVHLLFAFHYAWLYYRAPLEEDQLLHKGLDFAGDELPDYFDFMYHAFAIGMSSTASDISTTTREMRRITMVHGVTAFVFNIIVLALSVNIVAAVV